MPGIAENDWPRFGWSGAKLAVIYPPHCNYLTWQQLVAPLCAAPVQVERLAVAPHLSAAGGKGHRRVYLKSKGYALGGRVLIQIYATVVCLC